MNTNTPYIKPYKCTHCGGCASVCPVQAIIITDKIAEIRNNCIECLNCTAFCPVHAINKESDN